MLDVGLLNVVLVLGLQLAEQERLRQQRQVEERERARKQQAEAERVQRETAERERVRKAEQVCELLTVFRRLDDLTRPWASRFLSHAQEEKQRKEAEEVKRKEEAKDTEALNRGLAVTKCSYSHFAC